MSCLLRGSIWLILRIEEEDIWIENFLISIEIDRDLEQQRMRGEIGVLSKLSTRGDGAGYFNYGHLTMDLVCLQFGKMKSKWKARLAFLYGLDRYKKILRNPDKSRLQCLLLDESKILVQGACHSL